MSTLAIVQAGRIKTGNKKRTKGHSARGNGSFDLRTKREIYYSGAGLRTNIAMTMEVIGW